MLELNIIGGEDWDSETERFIYTKDAKFFMEYSLKAIAEWESFYEVPFLSHKMNFEEQVYFFQCMCLGNIITEKELTPRAIADINAYLMKASTATKVVSNESSNRSITTSEVIYSYMSTLKIPYTCDTWNIKRLFMLIDVRTKHMNPEKSKMSQREMHERNQKLNEERRKKYNTKG